MVRASAVRSSGEIAARASGAGVPTVTVVPPAAVSAIAFSNARAEPAASMTSARETEIDRLGRGKVASSRAERPARSSSQPARRPRRLRAPGRRPPAAPPCRPRRDRR